MKNLSFVKITAVASYLPPNKVENSYFETILDTSDEWIKTRTGISSRFFARTVEGEPTHSTTSMAAECGKALLLKANLQGSEVDGLIISTTTPDYAFPSVASQVAAELGMGEAFAMDVQAVCSGFIYALSVANSMIATGQAKRLMVIGSEVMSRYLDFSDRGTAILFGDGAAGFLLERQEEADPKTSSRIIHSLLRADGRHKEELVINPGYQTKEDLASPQYISMNGREVFRYAVTKLSQVVAELLEQTEYTPEEVDWVVPHQANARIIRAVADKLNIPEERVVLTVDRHANTSSASIPLAFTQAVEEGKVQRGDLVILEAFGAGYTWGAVLLRY